MKKEDGLQRYISEVDRLLGEIYLIGINDVGEDVVMGCYYSNESAEECVRWIGLKYNLFQVE